MNMSSWISSRDEWLREGERNDGLSPLRESGDVPGTGLASTGHVHDPALR